MLIQRVEGGREDGEDRMMHRQRRPEWTDGQRKREEGRGRKAKGPALKEWGTSPTFSPGFKEKLSCFCHDSSALNWSIKCAQQLEMLWGHCALGEGSPCEDCPSCCQIGWEKRFTLQGWVGGEI